MSSKASVSVSHKKRSREQVFKKIPKEAKKVVDESNSAEESAEDEEIVDDELDLKEVPSMSEGESESDSESEHENDDDGEEEEEETDDFPRKKKSKKSKHDDGSTDFSSAVNAILSSHLKAYDRKDPIMARNKKVLKQNDSDKLEQKAKRQITVEKKKLLTKSRKRDIIPVASEYQSGEDIRKVLEKEARLRKIAQKGAVKLFNAILSTQVKTEKEVNTNLNDIKNRKERKELITEVSKEKFLDLVKAAGDDDM